MLFAIEVEAFNTPKIVRISRYRSPWSKVLITELFLEAQALFINELCISLIETMLLIWTYTVIITSYEAEFV